VTALGKLIALATLGLTVLPAAAPAQTAPRGPNVLIVGTDTDKDAVPRGTAAFDKILEVIAGQLRSRGFHVFDETAIAKAALPAGGLPREPAELVETAKFAKVPIDVIVVTQMSASVRLVPMVRDVYKPLLHVVARVTKVRSGELLGRYDFGDDAEFPMLPGSCATSRECLLESVGNEARLIGVEAGNGVATALAATIRGAN
jgi:hypothetical protein